MLKPTVLIVDDEKELCAALCLQLSMNLNIDCDFCYSGEQALQKLNDKIYDVLLTDIKMPGMNGIELIKVIKQETHSKIIAYAMTGYSEYSESDVLSVGGQRLFHKPDDISEIVKTILSMTQSKSSALETD